MARATAAVLRSHRRKVTFDNSAQPGNLNGTQVLIALKGLAFSPLFAAPTRGIRVSPPSPLGLYDPSGAGWPATRASGSAGPRKGAAPRVPRSRAKGRAERKKAGGGCPRRPSRARPTGARVATCPG
jgi:hypothetical protein